MKIYLLVLFVILFCLSDGLLAQRRPNSQFAPYSELGAGAGTAIYFGDLSPPGQFFQSIYPLPRWNMGAHFTRHISPHVSAVASFTWIRLVGDDYTLTKEDPNQRPVQFQRNLHFRNDLKELALSGVYQFIADGRKPWQRPVVTPYFTLGIALVAHNPIARMPVDDSDAALGSWVALQPLGTEGQGQPGYARTYSRLTLAVPAGLGIRWKYSESLTISAELSLRYTFTDYLDDVSGSYPNPQDLPNNVSATFSDRRYETIAARTKQDRIETLLTLSPISTEIRGSVVGNDFYTLTQLAIHYVLPARIKCPSIR